MTVLIKAFELQICVISFLWRIWSLFASCVQPYARAAVTTHSAEVVLAESPSYSTFLSFASYDTNVSTRATTIANRG